LPGSLSVSFRTPVTGKRRRHQNNWGVVARP
jgi:hypothetical protein